MKSGSPTELIALTVLPSRPLRTMAAAFRKHSPYSLRCWVPTWNTAPVSLATRRRIFPSSTVSVSGFFAIDILAGLHGVDGDLRVPVVRRADRHRLNIIPVEDLPVVGIHLALPAVFRGEPLERTSRSHPPPPPCPQTPPPDARSSNPARRMHSGSPMFRLGIHSSRWRQRRYGHSWIPREANRGETRARPRPRRIA